MKLFLSQSKIFTVDWDYDVVNLSLHRRDLGYFEMECPEFTLAAELREDLAKFESMWGVFEEFNNGLQELRKEDWISFRHISFICCLHFTYWLFSHPDESCMASGKNLVNFAVLNHKKSIFTQTNMPKSSQLVCSTLYCTFFCLAYIQLICIPFLPQLRSCLLKVPLQNFYVTEWRAHIRVWHYFLQYLVGQEKIVSMHFSVVGIIALSWLDDSLKEIQPSWNNSRKRWLVKQNYLY